MRFALRVIHAAIGFCAYVVFFFFVMPLLFVLLLAVEAWRKSA